MLAVQMPRPQQRLECAVDEVVAEPIEHMSDAAPGDDLVALRRAVDRLEAEFLRRLHRFEARQASLRDGVATVAWLRQHCRMTARHAACAVHLARALGELPATLASARAGRASLSNAALIGRLAGDLGPEVVAPAEPALLRAAEELAPGPMHRLVEETRLRLDAAGTLDAATRAHERRWFACEPAYGGVFVLRGQLDTEGGMLVRTAIEALLPVPAATDGRSAGQRRADALVDLASGQLRRGGHGDVHGSRPHLTVTTRLEALQGETEVALPELAGYGPVHPETARRLACDAARSDVTVSSDAAAGSGHPMPPSVGRTRRTIPAHLRRALAMRDSGCTFPGCDRPPEWTEAHHIVHWCRGGATALENLASLCRLHHRVVHEGGWRVSLSAGRVVVAPPDG